MFKQFALLCFQSYDSDALSSLNFRPNQVGIAGFTLNGLAVDKQLK